MFFVRDAAALSETEVERRIRELICEAKRLQRSPARSLVIRLVEDLAVIPVSMFDEACETISTAFEAARAMSLEKRELGVRDAGLALITDSAPDPAEIPALTLRQAFAAVNGRRE